MFKKLKDKIAEEVKQSPLKFQTSVQNFTQSVSPSLSFISSPPSDANTTLECREDEAEDSLRDSEYDNSFTTVDLRSPATPKNRHSSSSSANNDLFPVYEFPRQLVLQSDLESCSEFDDGSSIHQFNNVTKENLYEKYRTALQKYHKYRGRFTDLQKYCKELQRELTKAKNVLTETQDKAIRRIVELKEQCSLEQKAKAHLEDALRNELEERGHLINTLNTKVELLKCGKNDPEDETSITTLQRSLKLSNAGVTDTGSETDILREEIQKLETHLDNARGTIASMTIQIEEFRAKAETDQNNLKSAEDRIGNLEENVALMRRKEEEALLSVAENKLNVHQELEAKESQIKTLLGKIVDLNEEMKKIKTTKIEAENQSQTRSNREDEDYEALKHELQLLTASRIADQKTIAEKDSLIHEFEITVDTSNQELVKLRNEIEASALFSRSESAAHGADHLKSLLADKQAEFESTVQQLTATRKELELKVQQLEQELSVAKTSQLEKSTLCESLEERLASLASKLRKSEADLANEETFVKEKSDEVRRLMSELSNANTKIKEYANEKKLWTETETQLKADKIVLEEQIKSIRKELNTVQAEVKNAKSAASDLEKDANERKKLERRLAERENELAQLKTELEHDKETEHEMLVRTANLLEEINALKTKQDDHLREIRTLKADLHNLQNVLKMTNEAKVNSDKANADLSSKIERLNFEVKAKREIENELTTLRDKLVNSEKEAKELRAEALASTDKLERLRRSNQEMNDLKLKLDSLQRELHEADVSKENLLSERNDLEVEIDRLRTEYDGVVTELKNVRLAEEQNQSNASDGTVGDEVKKLKDQYERLVLQNEGLKCELSEEKEVAANRYKKLEDVHLEARKAVEDFLTELHPTLEHCVLLRRRLIHEEMKNSNLTREITANVDVIRKLEAQLTLSSQRNKNSVPCNKDTLFTLRRCVSSLKNEHARMKNDVLDQLNSLKLYSDECNLKMKNGPVQIVRDNMNYIAELENRSSDLESVGAQLKSKVLEYENENRLLLSRVEEFASNPSHKDQLRNLEKECADRIRLIVNDFEGLIQQKDEKYDELERSALENRNNVEMSQTAGKQQQNAEILENEMSAMREQHAKELREIDKRWRSCLDKRVQEVEERYKEEINELTKEWSTDRKRPTAADCNISPPFEMKKDEQALEKYATRNEDAEALKKQVELLSTELCNYKRSHWKNIELDTYTNSDSAELSLEDCTELEYLRNILFQYMMGHQPLVLAKVLAAVVKFDSNQTRQVLEKEEQKVSLLGHLRLS